MDKKAYLAVGLSLLIWVGWQKYYLEPIQQRAALEAQRRQVELAKQANQAKVEGEKRDVPALSKAGRQEIAAQKFELKVARLENSVSTAKTSNSSWFIQGWELKGFSRNMEKLDEKVTLNDATGFSNQLRVRFSDQALSALVDQNWSSIEKPNERTVVSKLNLQDLQASRSLSLDETGFGGVLEYQFRFGKEVPKFIFLDLLGSPKRESDKEGSIFGQAPDKVHVTFRDLNGRHSHMGAQLKENLESAAGVRWLGLDTRYFVIALVPQLAEGSSYGAQAATENSATPAIRGSLVFPSEGRSEIRIQSKVYFGPKEMAALKSVDPILVDAIDFGWTSFIAVPLLQALKWLFSYMKNYGIAIIALTFIIKMLLFPLTYKSMKSMAKMSKLQPQLNALREKYKDDKEKLNVEMMNFMKSNGYNPVGGCLPILLQMPIFFALYRVLFNSMELYQAPFVGWIHDLSAPDPFFVTPVLLTGLMYLQQKLTPNTAADPAQQKMLQIMPLMFGAFMLMLPSGLTIYMVVNSAVSIGQQYFLNRKLGIYPKPSGQTVSA